jgi:hypothetical protein
VYTETGAPLVFAASSAAYWFLVPGALALRMNSGFG